MTRETVPETPLEILWLATKLPFPAQDGGRLVQRETIAALAAAGHRLTVLAPRLGAAQEAPGELGPHVRVEAVAGGPRPLPLALVHSLFAGLPATILRHRLPAVRRRLRELLERRYDVLHVEQLQAFGCGRGAGVPMVLRAQNVEHDLWRGAATVSSPLVAALLRREAARLRRFEALALPQARRVVALTESDRRRLAELAPGAAIEVVPPPFPARLEAGAPLPGEPPVVLLAGSGWRPNEDAARWFVGEVWPHVLAATAGARLHLFGGGRLAGCGVSSHPAPSRPEVAFPEGGISVVPLRVGSGIRMKILEAWSRGVPVVATSVAAAGLEAEDGIELLLADTPAAFAASIARLAGDPALGRSLVAAGRQRLLARHRPPDVAAQLAAIYRASRRAAP